MTTRQLLKLVTKFRHGILGTRAPALMCRVVCYPLQGYLSFLGVETTIKAADFLQENGSLINHVWLERPNGMIIDPTASQFADRAPELPAVYIGPLPEIYRDWMTSHA